MYIHTVCTSVQFNCLTYTYIHTYIHTYQILTYITTTHPYIYNWEFNGFRRYDYDDLDDIYKHLTNTARAAEDVHFDEKLFVKVCMCIYMYVCMYMYEVCICKHVCMRFV